MVKTNNVIDCLKKEYPNLVQPNYINGSINLIPAHIKYLHGLETQSALPGREDTKPVSKTVLFILDGFGYAQWNEHRTNNTLIRRISEKSNVSSITSMFPSSTPPSLAGLYTGLTTQQHGLLDWWMYERVSDQIITTLPFAQYEGEPRDSLLGRLDPSALLSEPAFFADLCQKDVASYTLVSKAYSHSTFSKLAYAGSEVLPHASLSELFKNLKLLLEKSEKAHINVYWGDIDGAGHEFGPSSPEYAAAVQNFFTEFGGFLEQTQSIDDSESIVIQMTADHGQIDVDPTKVVWLDQMPGLPEKLAVSENGNRILPWGAQRDVFLKIKEGIIDTVAQELSDFLEGKAVVLKSVDALSAGLFGQGDIHSDFLSRIGDILILPLNSHTVWYRHFDEENFTFKGVHGGLTSTEVLVPYVECALNDLVELETF